MKNKTVLVLGGTGYLGAKIVRKLVENNNKVIITKRNKSNIYRISDIADKVTFISSDVSAVETAIHYENIDWILNMICNYGRSNVLYDTVIESNIMLPLSVLNIAAEHGIKNFLTIGTGLPAKFNMYSFSKDCFAGFGKFYVEKHGINFIDLRLEMFYGCDEPDDRFIKRCVLQCLQGEELLLTDGMQHRDIIAIDDVVSVILYAVDYFKSGYNDLSVGTGEAPTVREIIEYIHKESKSTSNLRFGAVPRREGEPDCRADISCLEAIGYKCKYSWQEGLSKMIEELRK